MGGQTKTAPEVGPEGDNRQGLTSEMLRVTESGISWASPVRVPELVESLCREFILFRNGKVRAAWEVLRERGSILDKVLLISQRHKRV